MISISSKKLLLCSVLFISLVGIGCQTTEPAAGTGERTTPQQAIPANAQSDEGLFTVYQSGNKIFYEIPNEMLGRDMAIMSRIAKTAEGLGWGGDRLAGQQVV